MMSGKPIKIVGLGKYLPQEVSSADLEQKHGLPQGWSEKYSGVKSRHHITFESIGYMGAKAIEQALEKCQMELNDIDLLISASAGFDYPLPSQSSIIKSELKDGMTVNIPALDVDSSCLSFVSAFEIASSLLDGKKYKNIVIVSSEIASTGLNPNNWETLTLFGDGAVAAILQFDSNTDSAYLKSTMQTYSEGVYDSTFKGGGMKLFFKDNPYDPEIHSFAMNGRKLLRLAKTHLPDFIDAFFEDIPIKMEETNAIIPHQASKLGVSILSSLYKVKENQVLGNLATYGNCIAASIPLVLHDAVESGAIKRGDICFIIGTAAGFSIGGLLLKF
ncbi:3-oxoacyl-ACP synthase [Emticicia aquatilis]|uniref:3-oxoacyl-ACP synthase n=1 Tax=Emticicia aquatilis TaxID=1537369 RepID=A0A917DSN4_9BACT|nr:3-oxoacyl-[acyl-carrier-protein] synthase III C-terminal domain-containing protein [Emticicia aquatilis]GGD62922.1 3-oxoacyl-ACP synthase [Emticicia aquatilis]